MDGSIIVLDTTGADTSSSVICLDSSIENTPATHTHDLARNLCKELGESGRESAFQKSLVLISDTSEDEIIPTVKVEKKVPTQDPNKEKPLSNKDEGRKGKKRKRSEKQPTTPASQLYCTVVQEEESVDDEEGDKENVKRRSTPTESQRKIRKVQVHSSTPVSRAMSSPALPAVTPITVKYERIRSELSATKKMMHQTLLTAQEDMQKEMQKEMEKIRTEFAKKQKEDDSKMIDVKCDEDSVLRPVVIDGSNVAMSHGNHKVFSCKGIALCIQYFQQRGHKNISVLLPLHRKTAMANRTCKMTDAHILDDLESKGLLSFTPSRQLHGRRVTPYDDRFILELACRNGGVIISNDNYRDLMRESDKFRQVVEKRLIMYVFSGDNFMVPEDPHGRYGPTLTDVLRKDSEWSRQSSPSWRPVARASSLRSIVNGPIPALRRSPRIARILMNSGTTSRFSDNHSNKNTNTNKRGTNSSRNTNRSAANSMNYNRGASNNYNNNRGASSSNNNIRGANNISNNNNHFCAISSGSNIPSLLNSYPKSANNCRVPCQNNNRVPFQSNVLTKFAHQLINNNSQPHSYLHQYQMTGRQVFYPR